MEFPELTEKKKRREGNNQTKEMAQILSVGQFPCGRLEPLDGDLVILPDIQNDRWLEFFIPEGQEKMFENYRDLDGSLVSMLDIREDRWVEFFIPAERYKMVDLCNQLFAKAAKTDDKVEQEYLKIRGRFVLQRIEDEEEEDD